MIYNAIGEIKISGCAIKKAIKFFETTFSVGSKAWIRKKAEQGEIEFIYIKKINRNLQEAQAVITYVDTLNRVWEENELTWEEDAIDFAKLYWQIIKKYAEEQLLKNCPPNPPCS